MTLHDAYARFTPYELSIPGREFAENHFPLIVEEGESRGTDLADPGGFVMLAAAGAALREIRGEEDDPGLIEQYGDLLFHGFHFWRSGEPLYLLDVRVARLLVESEPDFAGWAPALPSDSGYVQLPRHLFWAHSEDEIPPEPLDGFFWTSSTRGTLTLLAAMGMREDRPGLSVIPLPPLPLAEVAAWAAEPVRGEGDGSDFESLLPGGELDRLYSVATPGEILKLAARVLWYLQSFPGDVGPEEGGRRRNRAEASGPAEGETDPADRDASPPVAGHESAAVDAGTSGSEGPLSSALPWRRIRLGGEP